MHARSCAHRVGCPSCAGTKMKPPLQVHVGIAPTREHVALASQRCSAHAERQRPSPQTCPALQEREGLHSGSAALGELESQSRVPASLYNSGGLESCADPASATAVSAR